MYASDYGYASGFQNWTTYLGNYDKEANTNNNWMYIGFDEWTISPEETEHTLYCLSAEGNMDAHFADIIKAIRPAFYLKFDVVSLTGNGTMNNPYRLGM